MEVIDFADLVGLVDKSLYHTHVAEELISELHVNLPVKGGSSYLGTIERRVVCVIGQHSATEMESASIMIARDLKYLLEEGTSHAEVIYQSDDEGQQCIGQSIISIDRNRLQFPTTKKTDSPEATSYLDCTKEI